MRPFTSQSFVQRVLFNVDHLSVLPELVDTLGFGRVLVVSTPGHAKAAEAVSNALGARSVGTFAGAQMHTPQNVTKSAENVLKSGEDIVSIGGGSAIGLGKALCLRTGSRHIAIPTTYAGSEMTPVLGQTENLRKTTIRDPKVVPEAVIYDVGLTLSLPHAISAASGFNGLAHAVEALYAPDRDPLTDMLAESAIAAFFAALPSIAADPDDRFAREQALYGAFLAGRTLAGTSMGLHHKLAHILGGMFDLPHAQMHAVLLPHVVAFNEVFAPDRLAPIARALNTSSPSAALFDLARQVGVPSSLAELGMEENGIEKAIAAILADPPANPRPIDKEGLSRLLQDALRPRR